MSEWNVNICVVSFVYPTYKRPEYGVFVRTLVEDWLAGGQTVDVIAPITPRDFVYDMFRRRVAGLAFRERVIRPLLLTIPRLPVQRFRSAPLLHKFGLGDAAASIDRAIGWLNQRIIESACNRAFRRLGGEYDVIYGKFLFQGAAVALSIASLNPQRNALVCADVGESMDWLEEMANVERDRLASVCARLDLLFCVSAAQMEFLKRLGVDGRKLHVFSNTVKSSFRPMSRLHCRDELGFSQDAFILIFVGSFCARKGAHRILAALSMIDLPVSGVFIGRSRGPRLEGPHVIFCGSVDHGDLPRWLNAADVLVAPSTSEGNSNAINEAMACGLPLITSDIPEIKAQAAPEGTIFIDPMDVGQIGAAIKELFFDRERLAEMSGRSLDKARHLNAVSRPARILEIMLANRIDSSLGHVGKGRCA
jgi:glycosyltransferase involved in cell wall biosynthesis